MEKQQQRRWSAAYDWAERQASADGFTWDVPGRMVVARIITDTLATERHLPTPTPAKYKTAWPEAQVDWWHLANAIALHNHAEMNKPPRDRRFIQPPRPHARNFTLENAAIDRMTTGWEWLLLLPTSDPALPSVDVRRLVRDLHRKKPSRRELARQLGVAETTLRRHRDRFLDTIARRVRAKIR